MPSGAQFAMGIRYGTPFSASTFNNEYGGIVGDNPVVVTRQSSPPVQAGTYYIAVLIVTSPQGTGTVTATVTAGASAISTDATLSFGNVTVGQSRDLSLAVRNTGTETPGVTSITGSNAQFQVLSPATPFSIAAGSQRDVVIRFQPSAAGSQSATLTIRSDDPGRPSVTVALSGQGTAAAPLPATTCFRLDAELDGGFVVARPVPLGRVGFAEIDRPAAEHGSAFSRQSRTAGSGFRDCGSLPR